MVDGEVSFSFAQEIGEKLSSAHANSIVRVIAERLILVVFRDSRVELLLDLANEAHLAEVRGFQQARPVHFFFMRLSMRLPAFRQLTSSISGLIR